MSIRVEDIEAAMAETLAEREGLSEKEGLVERSMGLGAEEAILALQTKLELKAAQAGQLIKIRLPKSGMAREETKKE